MSKNKIDSTDLQSIGHGYYTHCLQTALLQIREARKLLLADHDPAGKLVDSNHQLHHIQDLLEAALEAS